MNIHPFLLEVVWVKVPSLCNRRLKLAHWWQSNKMTSPQVYTYHFTRFGVGNFLWVHFKRLSLVFDKDYSLRFTKIICHNLKVQELVLIHYASESIHDDRLLFVPFLNQIFQKVRSTFDSFQVLCLRSLKEFRFKRLFHVGRIY